MNSPFVNKFQFSACLQAATATTLNQANTLPEAISAFYRVFTDPAAQTSLRLLTTSPAPASMTSSAPSR